MAGRASLVVSQNEIREEFTIINYCYEFLQDSLDILGEEFEKKKLWVFFQNSTTEEG